MTTDELIEIATDMRDHVMDRKSGELADAILALVAEKEATEAKLAEAEAIMKSLDMQAQWWKQEAAAAEAREKALRELAQEVWDSIPATCEENDPTVQRHARALNALGAALAAGKETP